jgi:hypothetical protein
MLGWGEPLAEPAAQKLDAELPLQAACIITWSP